MLGFNKESLQKILLILSLNIFIIIAFTKWVNADDKKKLDNYRIKLTSHKDAKLLMTHACITCHTTDGSRSIGPSFLELAKGKTKIVDDNKKVKEVTIDADYIRRSIIDPSAEVVQGYRKFSMPEQKNRVSKQDLEKLVNLLTPDK